ncbi:hypothetical protein CRM22_006484 [Opisthorchis felineus]|nr:hypothetical protein CRM22_006484 [Opisthorchis felineus]
MYNRWNKSDKVESKLGYSVKRHLNEEIVYRDRESQIAAIEATFKAAKKPITKHYSKPNVHAVEVLPVLPDFTLWRYPCAQVIFDDDPARKNKSNAEQKEEVNQAMIRGMVDESGDHFVAYFLPTESTKQLRRLDIENHVPYTEGAAYEYELAREYNWNVKNKTMANYEENYFFVFRKDGVFYNELETRVRLSKRRKLTQSGSFMTGGGGGALPAPKTRLIVHHRDFTDEELKAQTDRLYMLEHDIEEEDEEEDEDEEEEDGAHRAHERSGGTEHGSTSEGHSDGCEDELHDRADNDAQEEDTDEFRETQSEASDVEEVPARSSHSAKKPMAKRSPSEDEEEEEAEVEDEEDEEDDDLADSPSPASPPPQRSRRPSATSSGSASKKSATPAKSRHTKKALVSDDDLTDTDDEEVPNKPSKTHKSASGQRTPAAPVKTSQVFDSDDDDESDLSDLSD